MILQKICIKTQIKPLISLQKFDSLFDDTNVHFDVALSRIIQSKHSLTF